MAQTYSQPLERRVMKQARSIELFQYWNRLRGDRPAPRRAEVEPADIKLLLADTFILERDMSGEGVFRLAGTHLCSLHGRELKGSSFASLWRARDRRLVSRMVANVLSDSSVVVLSSRAISEKGRACAFELLLLPLDGAERHPRCLGIASPTEKAYWLGADAIVECAAESVRVVDPNREPLFLANRPAVPVPPLAPSRADLQPLPGARRVGHLLVLEGGKSAVD